MSGGSTPRALGERAAFVGLKTPWRRATSVARRTCSSAPRDLDSATDMFVPDPRGGPQRGGHVCSAPRPRGDVRPRQRGVFASVVNTERWPAQLGHRSSSATARERRAAGHVRRPYNSLTERAGASSRRTCSPAPRASSRRICSPAPQRAGASPGTRADEGRDGRLISVSDQKWDGRAARPPASRRALPRSVDCCGSAADMFVGPTPAVARDLGNAADMFVGLDPRGGPR